MTTTLFADSVYKVRRGSLAVYLCNHFATVTEGTIREPQWLSFTPRIEACTGRLPERCRAGFPANFNFGAVRELECLGSDIPVETVIAELAGN